MKIDNQDLKKMLEVFTDILAEAICDDYCPTQESEQKKCTCARGKAYTVLARILKSKKDNKNA